MKVEKWKLEHKEVKTREKVEYICDKCGKEYFPQSDEDEEGYHIKESCKIIFKREEEAFNTTWGEVNREYAYFCIDCYKEIKNILEDIGVKFEKDDWYW